MSSIVDNPFDFSNQIVLVTGASRGIGAVIADWFAARGAMVVGTATTEAGIENIEARFKKHHYQGKAYVVDVSKPAEVDALIKTLEEADLLPTILINNAGVTRDNLMLRMKPDEWNAVIDTNLTGVFYLTKACLRPMLKQRFGRIINIGSVVGSMGNPGQCNYAAAKAGLLGFTKSLAKEVAARGITINVVSPGFIETDMTNQLNETQKAAILTQIPMERLGQPSDIAAAVGFLASKCASYITGENLAVNGGMWMP